MTDATPTARSPASGHSRVSCADCGERVEGTHTTVEDRRTEPTGRRVLCPACYREFMSERAGHARPIRVFQVDDRRLVVLGASGAETGAPAPVESVDPWPSIDPWS